MDVKITPIRFRFDTAYVLHADGMILVDGGDPGKFSKFREGLEKAAIEPDKIQLITLTHGHWDHVGSTMEIKKYTGARVLLHQKDLHQMEGSPPPEPTGFTTWGRIIIAVLKLATRSVNISPLDVDILAGDGDFSLGDFGIPGKVMHTPGHSPGSVSVVLEDGKAFVGDLAMNMIPMRFSPGLPIFGEDMDVIKDSWWKLKASGVKTVYPAHGKPFPADVIYHSL